MPIPSSWLFPESLGEATVAQREMQKCVSDQDLLSSPQTLGGVDISNNLKDPAQMVYAAILTFSSQLEIVDQATHAEVQTFPYIPGFLGFREVPALVHTFEKLRIKPDILIVDGHGVSHPRGLGIATHLGLVLDRPTIGVAKKILVGKPGSMLGEAAGSRTPLVWKGKMIGMLLRTKAGSNPLIISSGHQVSLKTAVELVEKCLDGYRLPRTTRSAHLLANQFRKEAALLTC